jgi:hypothetical protein
MNSNPLEPEPVSGDTSACVRRLDVNLVLSRGVSLSEEQLRQLSHAVSDDAVRLSSRCVCHAHVDARRVPACVDDRH